MSRAVRIHFSHHLCLQHSEGDFDRDSARRKPIIANIETYRAEFPLDERKTNCVGCRFANHGKNPVYTTVIADVTCPKCLEEWKGETKRAWVEKAKRDKEWKAEYVSKGRVGDPKTSRYDNWFSDGELTIRCWYTCCRHQGVPSPFATPTEEHQYLLGKRAKEVLRATRGAKYAAIMMPSDPITPELVKRIAELPIEDQPVLRPFLEYAKRVDKLLADASAGLVKLDELAHMAALAVRHPKQHQAKGKATPKLTEVVGDLARLARSAA